MGGCEEEMGRKVRQEEVAKNMGEGEKGRVRDPVEE
jgi:hypothetical protein